MVTRLAQGVLSREDPFESFLKVVPQNCSDVEIIYPVRAHAPQIQICFLKPSITTEHAIILIHCLVAEVNDSSCHVHLATWKACMLCLISVWCRAALMPNWCVDA